MTDTSLPTEEQCVTVLVQAGIRSFSQPDFRALPPEQQKVALEEDLLEAQSRPTTFTDVVVIVVGAALKIISGGGAIESAVGLVTGVPALVAAAKAL